MALNAGKHAQVIEDTLEQIEAGVFDNIKALENRVAELVNTGVLPQDLRSNIENAYREYAREIAQETGALGNISSDVNEQMDSDTSDEDSVAESALLEQSANTVEQTVNSGVEDMMTTLVMAGAVGAGTQALVDAARGRISGVFMESSDPLVRRTQRKLRRLQKAGAPAEEIREAARVIKERLTGVNVTASLRDLTSKSVSDTVMKFDGAYMAGKAKRAGVERWRYDGGIVKESREWCRIHEGQVYTQEEIEDLWTDGWAGKEEGDPFVVRGGYNCRHFWVPVEED